MAKRYVELKYGFLGGVLGSLWVLGEYFLGFHNEHLEIGRYTGYAAFIIPFTLFWFALREKRNRVLGGNIRLTQGMKTSLLVSIVAGIILGGFMFAYIRWINPEFVEVAVMSRIEELRTEGLTEEELVVSATGMIALLSAPAQAAAAFIGTIVQGLLIGFIYTFILSRKRSGAEMIPPPAVEMVPPLKPASSMPTQDIVTDLHIPTETDEPAEAEESADEPYENPLLRGPNS